MARDRSDFQRKITETTKRAAKKAYLSSFQVSAGEDETASSIADKVSVRFAEVFANEFAPDLAKYIDEQLDSQMFDTTKLIAPSGGGACAGVIKSI